MAKDDLLDCVGEVMDEAELKVASVGVFERILKLFMSLMMLISVYQYAFPASKKRKM